MVFFCLFLYEKVTFECLDVRATKHTKDIVSQTGFPTRKRFRERVEFIVYFTVANEIMIILDTKPLILLIVILL